MSNVGIYKITSPSNKVYIGQSCDIKYRYKSYKRLHCKQQIRLYNSFIKYGFDQHLFEIIEECEMVDLNEKERYWQEYYNCTDKLLGLNCSLTKSSTKSGKQSEETKLKISTTNKGKKRSDEIKERISEKSKGRIVSLSSRIKARISNKNSKIILDINTGVFYYSLVELCDLYNLSIATMCRKFTNKYPNNTQFIYTDG